MKHLLFFIVSLWFISSTETTFAQKSFHTDFWKLYTPVGSAYDCRSVTSKKSLKKVLNKAGWDWRNKELPDINWNKDEAVVVAPSSYPKDSEMVFHGLFKGQNNTIVLKYGFKTLQEIYKKTAKRWD